MFIPVYLIKIHLLPNNKVQFLNSFNLATTGSVACLGLFTGILIDHHRLEFKGFCSPEVKIFINNISKLISKHLKSNVIKSIDESNIDNPTNPPKDKIENIDLNEEMNFN